MLEEKNEYFSMVERALKGFMQQPFPEEKEADPLAVTMQNMFSPFLTAADVTKLACNMVMYAGFYYLITQDEKVGKYGVDCLLKLADWDPDGVTSYKINDQAHRRIAVYSTLGYDWLFPLLTQEEKKKVRDMIRTRVEIICESDEYNIKNLDKSPFDSHGGTAIGYVTLMGLALYRDIPEAEKWLKYTLPLYINSLYPWSNEDGGWAQGTYYWSCNIFGKKVIEALLCSGVINLYQKTWQKNEPLYPLYCCPEGSVGAFGDNSYIPATAKVASLVSVLAHRIGTPEAKWVRNQVGYLTAYGHTDDSDPSVCIYDKLYPSNEAYIPKTMPQEHYFKDIGWIAMHSDLEDPERISIFFKSSWYGSFNHSHPDQNSFIIQAYGKPLAIDSGYYDLYNYPFDKNYTRKTYAHNAITYNNGEGQPAMDILAKGRIIDYLSHKCVALAGGDATQAYKGELLCAKRWLIYVKPDVLIVVDDLEAQDEKESTFEYWLNAQKWAFLGEDGVSGKFVTDQAQLDMKILYPQNVESFISHDFAGPDRVPLYPVYEGHARWPVQKRIWFQTKPCKKTCILSALDIHRTGTPKREWPVEYGENYILIKLKDGINMLVNHQKTDDIIDTGYFAFQGTAALVGNDFFMLVNGKELVMDGVRKVKADMPVSLIAGRGELSMSTISTDAQITVNLPGIREIVTRKDVPITDTSELYGCTVRQRGDDFIFSLYNGSYDFRIKP